MNPCQDRHYIDNFCCHSQEINGCELHILFLPLEEIAIGDLQDTGRIITKAPIFSGCFSSFATKEVTWINDFGPGIG